MKKMNKKGFTIVELVIVIAVIAILAAVMIPTFSGIIDKANESAAKQQFMAIYKEGLALALSDDGDAKNETEYVGTTYKVVFDANGQGATVYVGTYTNGSWADATNAKTQGIKGYIRAIVSTTGAIELKTTISG